MGRSMRDLDAADSELLRRFRRGDEQAFTAIVRRFQHRICRLCAVWLSDPQLVEDAAQEVFLRSYQGLRRFRFRSAPFTWLYRTTRNVCHEFNRIRRDDALPELADDGPGPAGELQRYEAARRLRTVLAELPPRQQEVVLLRVFEDLPVRETARAMGCREGTVKALLHQATQSLRGLLDEEHAG